MRPLIGRQSNSSIQLLIGLLMLAALCLVLAASVLSVRAHGVPARASLMPVTGTVVAAEVRPGGWRGDNFVFRLAGGREFYYLAGEPKYRDLIDKVTVGEAVTVFPRRVGPVDAVVELWVNDRTILSYGDTRSAHDDRVHASSVAGGVLTVIGVIALSASIVQAWRIFHRSAVPG